MNKAVLFEPNEPASLTCNADGGPNNTYMWFLDGEAIEGRITDTLNLNQVEGGNYTCQVRNAAGSENASIIVTGTLLVFFLIVYDVTVYASYLNVQRPLML